MAGIGDFSLLVGAIAPPGTAAHQAWMASGAVGASPAALLALARSHGVVVQMARALVGGAFSDLREAFRKPARDRVLGALGQTAELSRVAGQFAGAGIPLIALKGPGLAQDIFGDPTARDPGDLDLLIRFEDLPAADRLLTGIGYGRDPGWSAALSDRDPNRMYGRVFNIGHLDYHHPTRGIVVEVHWRWFHVEEIVPFDGSLIWEGLRHVRIGSVAVPVLSPAVQLLYLSFHAAKHECERLKWLNDLSWLLMRLDDAVVGEAAAHARRLGILNLFLAPLLCAVELGATRLPPSLAALTDRQPVRRFAAHCRDRLVRSDPSAQAGLGQKYRRWRLYWRLASHLDRPRRLRLAARLIRVFLAALMRLCRIAE